MQWGFYGRRVEQQQLRAILARERFFFVKLSGRRRIGKTTLVQHVLAETKRPVLYMQLPDSGPAGVLSAVRDAFATFGVTERAPTSLSELASTIARLARGGRVVVIDEFQYVHRKHLHELTSHLQREVDALAAEAGQMRGGLFVLGSIQTELTALLEDKDAPLYNRATDTLDIGHLDIGSVLEMLRAHADESPSRLLTLWNLFEGVPKFYRDCYEQGALDADEEQLLEKMFFLSSAPLRNEAENWFLHELRGRYDVVLKFIARNPGCTSGDLEQHVRNVSPETAEQTAGYVKILTERYELIERRLPIFAKKKERKGRYYVRDNFLRAWLAALASQVAAMNFQPTKKLVERATARLHETEGHGFERLVGTLYEERSRKGLPGFALSRRIDGFWDSSGTEIDLVAVDSDARIIRFATCKRAPEKLLASLATTEAHISRYLAQQPQAEGYRIEKVAIAPVICPELGQALKDKGWIHEDLATLTKDLY
jgi:AAA+ ATPase superfamily predicted ATPase